MKKYLMYVLIAIVLGFISAEILYTDYKNNLDDTEYNAYLIQIGSFVDDNEIDADKYLVLEENGKYNVYVGVTTKLSNAQKIKKIYENDDYIGQIKPIVIDNVEFMSDLEQFDILIEEVENKDNLQSINNVIISLYEELILGK